MPKRKTNIVRRSVAVPRQLVEDVFSVAPPELKDNFNRLVLISLRDFVARRRAEAFRRSMAEMAADPAIRSECASMAGEFVPAGLDGLKS